MGQTKTPLEETTGTKIIIVAGGTGGHVVPAIAFAKWIYEHHPETEIRFYCGSRPLEREIFRSNAISAKVLPIDGSPLSGNMFRRAIRSSGLFLSTFTCIRDFLTWKPDACLLFGGYASLPALFAARFSGIRSFVHEQNAVAGKVTRLAASWGVPVLCGWENCQKIEGQNVHYTGIPVRNFRYLPPEDAWLKLNCKDKPPAGPIVLVLGGSLASGTIKALASRLAELEQFNGWTFLVVSTRENTVRRGNVIIVSRTWDMGPLYSLADCAISRGGASTLAELALYGIPAIIVPWKDASDDHQTENARVFAGMGYGFTWEEDSESLEKLAARLQKLPSLKRRKNSVTAARETERTGAAIWDVVFPKGDVAVESTGL
jgi:UDP-N-acetylglucosamine--N-acetylmuramyl-(pentapeptide) pyrophosphoryl-undecaprenol N-acetylglucosamine transferase